MTISSPDVSNSSSINRSFIDVTFTSSENTSDFTVDDIQINNGYLIDFSGSEKVYTATLIIIESDKTCTVDVPAGSFVGESFSNEAAQQFVWRKNIINVPIKKDKNKAKLITRILKMTESDTNSFLTQFRSFMANNTFSVSEKENFQDFLLKNGQYSRAILLRMFDLLDKRSASKSQVL